ncbi:MAG: hypothetical protein K0R25_8 [Rickettsiaceae bacterium]|jgi:probable rRNA maturation factor|nr:hypothetical protein [Rickettsiaceae bacterium]
MVIKTNIIIAENRWKKHSGISKKIKSLLSEITPYTPLANIDCKVEISILLTGDEQIQELNKNYRSKDKPTNVLSFPLLDGKKIKNGDFSKIQFAKNQILGDIAIAYQTVLRESQEQEKDFEHHLYHLVIHSLLHLIGFDHIKKSDAEIMEELEVKILKKLGIKNPYLS